MKERRCRGKGKIRKRGVSGNEGRRGGWREGGRLSEKTGVYPNNLMNTKKQLHHPSYVCTHALAQPKDTSPGIPTGSLGTFPSMWKHSFAFRTNHADKTTSVIR